MYKILFLTMLITFLQAHNPKPFAKIADPLYNNLHKITTFKNLNIKNTYTQNINKYIKDVKQAKINGFKIEENRFNASIKSYILELRRLEKINKYFLKSIERSYYKTIENRDTQTFTKLIKSGVIDLKKHKKEINKYCRTNMDSMELDESLHKILKEENTNREKKAIYKKKKVRKNKHADKIQRMRANDKREYLKLEKKLQKELEREKKEIRAEQERELCR